MFQDKDDLKAYKNFNGNKEGRKKRSQERLLSTTIFLLLNNDSSSCHLFCARNFICLS